MSLRTEIASIILSTNASSSLHNSNYNHLNKLLNTPFPRQDLYFKSLLHFTLVQMQIQISWRYLSMRTYATLSLVAFFATMCITFWKWYMFSTSMRPCPTWYASAIYYIVVNCHELTLRAGVCTVYLPQLVNLSYTGAMKRMPKINSNISYDWLQQDILFRYSRQHITKQMKLMYTTVSYGNMI